MTKIHPVAGFLLVEPQKKESTTASGILLPTNNQDKPQQGKVLAVGNSVFRDGREFSAPCEVNDIIMFKEWGVNEIKENDQNLFIIKFEDVMAIIN